MNVSLQKSRAKLSAVLLLTSFLGGCGYHFSEGSSGSSAAWRHTHVRVEGPGARNDPLLARALRQNLENRLGLAFPDAGRADDGKNTEKRELVIHLELAERSMHLEDRTGLADQYQISLRAQPQLMVGGTPAKPGFPQVKGVVIYNELRTVTASQAARDQAALEAMNQLAEEMMAVLDDPCCW
ncbi:MAG: hypothetical protein HQL63_09410 [Magnetococcales bacterium]|nr:hypothetical protein [Magnetococcales bacterium]